MAIVREASNLPDGINPNPDVHIPTPGGNSALPSVFVVGDLLAANSISTLSRIAAPAVGQVLKSNGVGVAPSWSATLALGDGTQAAPAFAFSGATGTGMFRSGKNLGFAVDGVLGAYFDGAQTRFVFPGTNGLSISGGPVWLSSNTTALQFGASADTGLSRISAGVIGVGTGAQGSTAGELRTTSVTLGGSGFLAFGGASTYLDVPSNGNFRVNNNSGANSFTVSAPAATASATFQHGALDVASPVAQTIKFQDVVAGTLNTAGVNAIIQAPAGTGTGAGGSLIFQVAPAGSTGTAKNAWATALTIGYDKNIDFAGNMTMPAAGSLNWSARGLIDMTGAGVFRFRNNSATQDFTITAGASNLATFNGQVNANGFNAGSGNIANSSGYIGTIGNFFFKGSADGVVELTGAGLTGSGFGRLQLGGTTSSFPAIKRSTTSLQARLADDSAFTNIQGKLTTDTAYTAGDPTTTGYLVVYDSTGTAYRVPALLN